jgi:hypothetical protein
MRELKEKYVLLLVCIAFPLFNSETSAGSLADEKRARLYDSMKRRDGAPLTIDVSYTTKTVTEPEAAKKEKEARMERTKIMREQSNDDSITIGNFDIALPDGSEIRLSETRIRIGTGLKLRKDTTIFANMEKTETHYEATTINTGFSKDDPSYEVEHTLKQVSIRTGRRFSGREVLRFGQVDEFIGIDVARLCNPRLRERAPKKKDFLDKGKGVVNKNVVDEIEYIDLESGKPKYSISLDPNDWKICRKIVWYDDKSGLVSKIVENKEFAEAKGNGNLFPRLIVREYFDSEGKKEKTEFVNITNVVIGLPLSEDIFKLDAPPEYSVIDDR